MIPFLHEIHLALGARIFWLPDESDYIDRFEILDKKYQTDQISRSCTEMTQLCVIYVLFLLIVSV